MRVEVGTLLACASCRKTAEEPSFQTTLGRREVVAAVWRRDEMEAMAFIAIVAVSGPATTLTQINGPHALFIKSFEG